jgi:decaprenylphospho-beta-D-ribofuranose 2-oxidase
MSLPSTLSRPRRRAASATCTPPTLPIDHLERVEAWGMSTGAMSYVYRPSTPEGVRKVFALAREHGLSVGLRGAGCSYGDASLNAEHICLDLTRMNRILAWNPEKGILRVEPGVTIRQVWQYVIEDGWWPYVVPGTMYPTLGGCAAMNIHGKNNWKVGPLGDHVLEFELMLPNGAVKRCSREQNADLFYAAIGGFGMLGCFLSLTLELKRVYSGLLHVEPIAVSNFGEMIRVFEERMEEADYLVGWVDCFAKGAQMGRGLVHQANYLKPGEDPQPAQTLRVENQELPEVLFGVLPKSVMWRMLKPFANNIGVRILNSAKYYFARRHSGHCYQQSHAGFAFLLDYVPNWKFAYKPGGLIQYQSFIPAARAEEVFCAQLERGHRRGIVPYLGVLKRHRTDAFLMTHSVDGYSFALDYKVTPSNRGQLWQLAAEMDQLVVEAGGRFYFAKDSTLSHHSLESYLAEERVRKFLDLKATCDPEGLLQTNLYRRLFLKGL